MIMQVKSVCGALNRMKTWYRLPFQVYMKVASLVLVVFSLSGCSLFSPYPISNNNDFSSSTLLSTTSYDSEYVYLSSFDKKDYYYFDVIEDGIFGVLLIEQESKQFAGYFTIYDSDRNPISDSEYLDRISFDGQRTYILTEGRYYISLERYTGYMYYSIKVFNAVHLW